MHRHRCPNSAPPVKLHIGTHHTVEPAWASMTTVLDGIASVDKVFVFNAERGTLHSIDGTDPAMDFEGEHLLILEDESDGLDEDEDESDGLDEDEDDDCSWHIGDDPDDDLSWDDSESI